uniref:RecF/RecN/SMC N-terminal domain-containing protein n=1 Tax=Globisporangium ultimum (strain ATCC 200006 / CBS 805.95 / DAOM BR144) TaxID=431595 RepID=K3WA28_GLOUD
MAVADLDKYYRALDQSLIEYHSKKIEEINTIIRSLWQITYKGQDIDSIEIVSGPENGSAAAMKATQTFCLNCGILALDEPTTNLDTENKYGLAQAITDLLAARSAQQNFQLVCITHDEEFVQMLGRTQAMDNSTPEYYWRISREELGNNRFYSKIERHEWRDGI